MKCPKCKEDVYLYPIFKRANGTTDVKLGEGIKILFGKQKGKIIWNNVFKINWQDLFFVAILLLLVFSYKHDMKICLEFNEKPQLYCSNVAGCMCAKPINYSQQATSSEVIWFVNKTQNETYLR